MAYYGEAGAKTGNPVASEEGPAREVWRFIERFLWHLVAHGYSPKTAAQYEWLLRLFASFLDMRGIGDVRAVTHQELVAFSAALGRRGLSSSTRSQCLELVRRFFASLVHAGELLVSPMDGIEPVLRRTELPRRVPTRAEMRQLLDAIDTTKGTGIRDRAIAELLYGSAVRVAELVALDVADARLGERLVNIECGKGGKDRMVPMNAATATWLRRYLDGPRARWALESEPALFLNNRGERMETNLVRVNLAASCRRAELPRMSPHAIRHAAATHMLACGADVRYVQELLGHSSVTTTQLYTRVVPVELKRTHQRTHPREVEP